MGRRKTSKLVKKGFIKKTHIGFLATTFNERNKVFIPASTKNKLFQSKAKAKAFLKKQLKK